MPSSSKVGIVDYESGNTRSVLNAVEYLGYDVVLSDKKNVLEKCSHIILPGVGSFKDVMDSLNRKELPSVLEDLVLKDRRYFLGICVGMQILAGSGEEFGEHAGLGWVEGKARKLKSDEYGLRLPHIGWNDVVDFGGHFILFRGLSEVSTFYFVHSYALNPEEELSDSAYAHYGSKFLAALRKENIFGVQFHPEKSQRNGLRLLENFCGLGNV